MNTTFTARGGERETSKLTCGVPQAKSDGLAVYHHVGTVIVKHSRDVVLGEGIRRVADQKASLANCTVSDDDALDRLHGGHGCLFWFG